jgi:UDP-glucose 4-epimerase
MPYIAQVAAERRPFLSVFGSDYPTRDGTGIRDYIHVVDLARAHVAALDYIVEHGGWRAWNLGTGAGTTVLELVDAFQRAANVEIPRRIVARRPGDVAETWADPTRANQELGWKATLTIDDMCADSWRWQQFARSLE